MSNNVNIDSITTSDGANTFAGVFNNATITVGKSESLNAVLNALPFAKDAPFNSYERQNEPTCLSDTRVDLLRKIYDWVDGEDSPGIFWLSGLAGTGKSTIAQTVAAAYSKKGQLAASFFFSRAGGDVNHAGKFITSIAFQIANIIPGLKRKICDAIAKHNNIASLSLDDQWQELVLGPLSSLENTEGQSKYVLVVDALDECDNQNNVQIILQRFAEVQGTQLRVLLTSRPEVPIKNGFTQVRQEEHHDFVLHDIEPAVIERDIALFLSYQLGRVRLECHPGARWPGKDAIARLVQNSGGLFIWAATACRFIEEESQLAEARLSSLLHQEGKGMLPPERKLDEIYSTVLASSIRREYTEVEIQMLHEQFRQVVGPVITMQDPLSIASLAELLGKDAATLRRTLANLHSVLDVPEADSSAIRLLHPSFRDFLLDPSRCSNPQFGINKRMVHREMYKHCLQAMSKHLRRDMCNLQDPGVQIADLSQIEVDNHIQPHVQYACRFWVYHCIQSDVDISSCTDVKVFFQKHFLHWLETLTLLKRGSNAVHMVHMLDDMFPNKQEVDGQARPKLRRKIKKTFLTSLSLRSSRTIVSSHSAARPSLQAVVHDATRFALAFRPVLEETPLQLYYAGLIFSPKASIIRQVFSNTIPPWLLPGPNIPDNWGPALQTLKGHSDRVTAVAFSPDSKTLAAGSDDKTVKLWDASSGKALQTLKGLSSIVTAIAFFPDGNILASRCADRFVQLWDASSGKALQTLKGPDSFKAAAFSPDGKTLASGPYRNTVELWDISGSGKALQTLKGHSDTVAAVAFSPDGKTLASGSDDKTVKLWDASGSGEALQTLKGHSGKVAAVAFSPDGKTLASGSYDKTVKLWDASSGKALRTLKGPGWVMAVAFSPDGKTLASGCDYSKVKLWDASSGKALQTLKGHSGEVAAIAFSPDGKTLVSGSVDKTVKLWDAGGSGKARQTLKGHWDEVTAVAFSPDSKTLASGSDDDTVKLWDASGSGEAWQTLKGHSGRVAAVAFSPDGKTLASVSYDWTVKLWDADGSGKTLQTLKGHSGRVAAVAFSPDSKTLASGSDDWTVKLWDASSGKALQTLKGHLDMVTAVAFSQDGKMLLSGSDDWKVKLWDAKSGKALQTLKGHLHKVTAVAFSPDGKTLASGSYDRTVKLWDASSGNALQTLKDFSDPLNLLWPRSASRPLLTFEGDWICRNRERVLWIPSEYRPSIVTIGDNVVGFGYPSGQVLILKFVT